MQHSEHKPVPEGERSLKASDLFFIWFGAAIAISEIWGGGLPSLAGVGLAAGLVAILIGRVIGNGLMGAMAAIGARSGLPTMVLTRPAFGIRGSILPAAFNVIQLLGWTGWMLFVGFLYMDKLAEFTGLPTSADLPAMKYVWIILLGALCMLWAAGGQKFWRTVQSISAVLLFVLTLAMTWIVLRSNAAPTLDFSGAGPLQMLAAADVVVAMSISWLPLVADYSRFSNSPRASAAGTFWGYFVGGTWMYAVGLLVASSHGITSFDSITPDGLVIETMGSAGLGWALAAIVLVLISTVTTTFLDIYSCVVSSQSLVPSIRDRTGNIVTGVLGILIALFLDTAIFEPFLLAIGAIFLPIFVIVLLWHYLPRTAQFDPAEIDNRRGPYWYMSGFNLPALLAWIVGFVVYDWARGFGSISYFAELLGITIEGNELAIGSSLPCILATAAAYILLVKLMPASQPRGQSD
ncbi:cytosine permease [bacterium]|nr:cytosine permease [bacterium]